jgi:hypothetical protein
MFALLCMWLLAATTRVELVDEVYQIAPGEWKQDNPIAIVPVDLRQQPATVIAHYEVQSGGDQIRIALMTRDDLERLREDAPHGVIAVTEPGKSGGFEYRVRHRGSYAVVVDNRSARGKPSTVRLRVALEFAPTGVPDVTRVSPQRQLTVIALSFLFFFSVVTYSARRLLRATRK